VCPDIKNYLSLSDYLFDYFEYSKSLSPAVSYRKIAKQLNWSISYFNEVIHGKRRLSINKGIEMVKFLTLSDLDAEKFILLLLKNSESEVTKKYFNTVIQKNYQKNSLAEVFPDLTSDEAITKAFSSDFSLIILYAFLRWRNSCFSKYELSQLLYSFPDFKDANFLDSKLLQLEHLNIIKILQIGDVIECKILKDNIVTSHSKETIHYFEFYFENQIKMVTSTQFKGSIHAGFIKIQKQKYMELLSRMAMLKNWMMQLEDETKDCKFEDQLMLQYDLSAMVAVDVEKLGINDFKGWLNN
jgi:hypothetical protein